MPLALELRAGVVQLRSSNWFWPAVVAVATWLSILAALDPAGDHPGRFDGPGLTVDEAFNAGQGVALIDRLLAGDLNGFRERDARLPDHPPLGRLWIGLCHEVAFLIAPPIDRSVPYSITCARTAPATAFAALVVLVGVCASRWYGRFGGAVAALALVLMPRVFGHAHLAALETVVNLTCTAAVLYLAARWKVTADSNPIIAKSAAGGGWCDRSVLCTAAAGGVLFGLALLTKVQAVFLPIPIAVWALWQQRWRALPALVVWGLTGFIVFFAFWPYLWSAPISHVQQYLGRTTNRAVLYVWYFGQVLADRNVPWHYSWVMFLTTVPVGLHLAGFCGVFGPNGRAWKSPRELLVLVYCLVPLCVFSIPGVAVYDGERLFSMVFPPWAVLIGRGAESIRLRLSSRLSSRKTALALGIFLAGQGYGLVALAPCWLSYYNLAVGGLPGATKLGLEVSYWGDGVTRTLLAQAAKELPTGETIAVAPVLYAGQWDELQRQSPVLKRQNIQLAPIESQAGRAARFVLLFNRPEYLPTELRRPFPEREIVASVRRQGVLLAALIDRHPGRGASN